MYSFSNLEPVCCSLSSSNCCFLTCMQVSQEAGQVVWCSHLSEFPTVCCDPHSQRLCIVNKAEDVFLELSCIFLDPADVGNVISGSSAFSKFSLSIWKFTVHVLLKPGLGEFWALLYERVRWVQLCSSLNILWDCLSSGLEWKLTFSSPVAITGFSKVAGILSAALSQHHLSGFEIAQLEFHPVH